MVSNGSMAEEPGNTIGITSSWRQKKSFVWMVTLRNHGFNCKHREQVDEQKNIWRDKLGCTVKELILLPGPSKSQESLFLNTLDEIEIEFERDGYGLLFFHYMGHGHKENLIREGGEGESKLILW